MLTISLPGADDLKLEHLVLDFNGTLACDGVLLEGVPSMLGRLAPHLRIHVVTADTFGTARQALAGLPVNVLCPYDIQLGTELIAGVEHTHPELTQGGRRWLSSSYMAGTVPRECDQPLSAPPTGAETLRYLDDLAGVRDFTARWARRAGLPPRRGG